MEDGGDRRIPAVVQNLAELIQRYHKLMPFIRDQDAKFKDINAIKAYWELREVIDRAAQKKADREAEKAREAAEKQEAIKGTEFVATLLFTKSFALLQKKVHVTLDVKQDGVSPQHNLKTTSINTHQTAKHSFSY